MALSPIPRSFGILFLPKPDPIPSGQFKRMPIPLRHVSRHSIEVMEIRPRSPSLDHSQADVFAIAQKRTYVASVDVAIYRRHVDAPALDHASEDDLGHASKRLLGFGRINPEKTELYSPPVPSLHRNSRRKPPNSFGWRNAANLSLPIYLLSPMKGVCLSNPCAKVLP